MLIADCFPPGVFNILVGHGSTVGQTLIEQDEIAKISFTGSVETGRQVYQTAAKRLKTVNLELGGKSPMLVLPDCPAQTAISGAVQGIRFSRQAQSCTSTTRVFVPNAMKDEIVAGILKEAGALIIGDPLDEATDAGTLISHAQMQRVQGFLQRAQEQSLTPKTVGECPTAPPFSEGAFMNMHVFVDPPIDCELARTEIFGPVMCVFGYDDVETLADMANNVQYGLSASIWGRDIAKCLRLANRLDVGFTQINQNAVMLPGLSYSGTKNSGFGCESSIESALSSFTVEKTNIINLL